MWKVGCGDVKEFKMSSDSLNTQKLQPLMPRPNTSTLQNTSYSVTPTPYVSCIQKTDLSALNYHLGASATDQPHNKREINREAVSSSRWNPTPEQLQALEEMYRCGTRTPTADQIQLIASKLKQFGKVEGKNVFYWFQNHKARERHKRRRLPQLVSSSSCGEQRRDIHNLERKEILGLSRTGFEVEPTKNWATPLNCTTLSEESVSQHRAVAAESKTDELIQYGQERELQQRNIAKQTRWQMMELSSSSTSTPHTYFLSTTTTNVDHKLSKETQTLDLFPNWRDDGDYSHIVNVLKNDAKVPIKKITTNFTPLQFFEFLPLKN